MRGLAKKLKLPGLVLGLAITVSSGILPWIVDPAPGVEAQGSTVPISPPKPPTPTPTPEGAGGSRTPAPVSPTAPASPPTVTKPDAATVDLSSFAISRRSVARDDTGSPVETVPGRFMVLTTGDGRQQAVFPLALAAGRRLASLHDPDTGIMWAPSIDGGLVTIPMSLAGSAGTVTIILGPMEGDGSKAFAPILGASLAFGPWFSQAATENRGSVWIEAGLAALPSHLRLNLKDVPPAGLKGSLEDAASRAGMTLGQVAYAVAIEGDLSSHAGPAVVEMGIGEGWAGARSPGNTRVMRVDRRGVAEVLVPTSRRTPDGQIVFRAVSKNGFSSFVLVTLDEPLTRGADPGRSGGPALLLLGGAVAAMALGGYLWVSNRRRTR